MIGGSGGGVGVVTGGGGGGGSGVDEAAVAAHCDTNMNSTLSNNNHKQNNGGGIMPAISNGAVDEYGFDIHSVMTMDILERNKFGAKRPINGLIETRNEEVLRRVAEMQRMVENSEKYLNEQGELVHEFEMKPNTRLPWKDTSIEMDSDSESMSSSKVSSNEDAPAPGVLKHSDSLVLLAESINLDLNGITKGLTFIDSAIENCGSTMEKTATAIAPMPQHQPINKLSETNGTPKVQRRVQGLSQLLSDLHALSNDLSQSESDSESVCTPHSSPIHRITERGSSNNKVYRTSFGLHSPDSSVLGPESKDTNLREYLRQLKEASSKEDTKDIDLAAQKLTELYGFEIGDDTFIDTDPDVIDLTAIPPPQTPDELDGLAAINASAPSGFGDASITRSKLIDDGDFEKFLAQVAVAPPTQKITPAKELTPEEIMSFIIPPPPGLADDEVPPPQTTDDNDDNDQEHSLYINADQQQKQSKELRNGGGHHNNRVIEYATVERKGPFSCCTKSKKNESSDESTDSTMLPLPPPRRCEHTATPNPPERPPKKPEAQTKDSLSPRPLNATTFRLNGGGTGNYYTLEPPRLPPRNDNNNHVNSPLIALPPRKPYLPPVPLKPVIFRAAAPNPEMSPPPNIRSPLFHRHSPFSQQPSSSPSPPPIPVARNIIGAATNNHTNGGHYRSYSDCPPPVVYSEQNRPQLSLLCSPQMSRRIPAPNSSPLSSPHLSPAHRSPQPFFTPPGSPRNGQHVINVESLLAKTDLAMAGLLVRLDQIAGQCSAAQTAGGGVLIDENRFQAARNELTDHALHLVTASKQLVMAMSSPTASALPEHLTSCLSALRRITELAQDMTRHTTAPLQTRNIVLKIHDVASSFRELAGVETGPCGAGPLALQAECLANVLATLLRSLRVFSP